MLQRNFDKLQRIKTSLFRAHDIFREPIYHSIVKKLTSISHAVELPFETFPAVSSDLRTS